MRWSKYCDELRAEIDRGLRDADTLYVMRPDEGVRFQQTSLVALDCRRIERYFCMYHEVIQPDGSHAAQTRVGTPSTMTTMDAR